MAQDGHNPKHPKGKEKLSNSPFHACLPSALAR